MRHVVETFSKHSSLEYHKKYLLDTTNFSEVLINPSTSIDQQLNARKTFQKKLETKLN